MEQLPVQPNQDPPLCRQWDLWVGRLASLPPWTPCLHGLQKHCLHTLHPGTLEVAALSWGHAHPPGPDLSQAQCLLGALILPGPLLLLHPVWRHDALEDKHRQSQWEHTAVYSEPKHLRDCRCNTQVSIKQIAYGNQWKFNKITRLISFCGFNSEGNSKEKVYKCPICVWAS